MQYQQGDDTVVSATTLEGGRAVCRDGRDRVSNLTPEL
jgi:hypothetical protein